MPKIRSPRYPSYPVGEAIDLANKIYRGDGLHEMDREVAVRHLGYTSLNGASATALGGLKQYGLTVDAGKGMIKLTSLALDILEPEGEVQRVQAILKAAFSPTLFGALREKFGDRAPSRENLRAHLIREGFTQAAIPSVVDAYLATCEYVANIEDSERGGAFKSIPVETSIDAERAGARSTILDRAPEQPLMTQPVVESELNKIHAEIIGDRVRVSAYLDAKGLALLKKKIAALETFLAIDDAEEGRL